ncbi:MAG: DUF1566 domain-containing protein [Prevotella sp.]|nr:DUF1566 domain-containing protein [Prevotella sp.]
MKQLKKTLLTLVALLAVTTGAWADETPLLTIESTGYSDFKSGSMSFDDKVTITFSDEVENDGDTDGWYRSGAGSLLTVAGINGYTITSCKFYTKTGAAANGYTIVGESPSVFLSQGFVYTDDSKSVNLGTAGVKKIEVYGGVAAAGYTVSMKDGVKDADKWTITPNPAEEGQTVTLQYNGRLKVKGVKATSDAAAEATPALSITSPSVGQVIGSDGKNYAYGSLPTGVTAVAKICYVSGSNGLALALADEGALDWSTANETCAAHTPAFTGGTWKLASQDEWNNMITTAGNQTDLRDGFSSVGGTNMEENCYWSSSEVDSESAWLYYFGNGQGYTIDDYKDVGYYVRACLAFTVEQSAKTPATVTTAPTGAAIVGVGKETALVSGGVADGGTLMYAVTTTNTKPASTDDFSEAVPTAQSITASGKVYVWYYVKGDDTHSDSEIAGPVSVTVTPALSLTNPVVGQVIGSDGKNYAAASVPSGVTKVAMIAYVSGSNGLAITLADEGEKNWATAKSTCEAKTPAFTNGTWHLPTQAEWNQMFSANGGNAESYNGLNAAINTAGGTTLQSGFYWSSSEYSPGVGAHLVHLDDGDADWSKANETLVRKVRACLAF